jgi:hypothetical protein
MDHDQQNSIVKDDDRIVIPVSGAAIGWTDPAESVCGGGRGLRARYYWSRKWQP